MAGRQSFAVPLCTQLNNIQGLIRSQTETGNSGPNLQGSTETPYPLVKMSPGMNEVHPDRVDTTWTVLRHKKKTQKSAKDNPKKTKKHEKKGKSPGGGEKFSKSSPAENVNPGGFDMQNF